MNRRVWQAALAFAAILSLAFAANSYAGFPYPAPPEGTAPQDYWEYMFLPTMVPPVRPDEFDDPGTAWKLTSATTGDPSIDDDPAELYGVEGMSLDLAWQVTTGRPDVLIAVIDCGIEWNNPSAMNDLRLKIHLNRGELPLPENAEGMTKPQLIKAGETFLNPDPYDLNDDGVFNVDDYANDPRVRQPLLYPSIGITPEDLIVSFSNHKDDDHNGYVDDIAGWNFLDDTNDPFDDVQYGHGTGEAEDSSAEADNGGDVGTCPSCMVMPVRVGDSFIADSDLFAEGAIFAVDSGAQVIQEALGAINDTTFAKDAINYAYDNNVPVIASAADEESFHHNVPAANRHTIVVNSVDKYADELGTAMVPNSYLYLNGCTNYGGNIAVSISSSSCSSEATGKGSGIAGLIISAAMNQVNRGLLTPRSIGPAGAMHPLSANEVRQLMTMTADDIDFSADRSVSFLFPTIRFASQPGWDEFFGAGRANANSAVRAVQNLAIPPEADILTPNWWETLDPVESRTVKIIGTAGAPRARGYGYELAYGCGVQPAEGDFTVFASKNNLRHELQGKKLGGLDPQTAATACNIDVTGTPSTAASGVSSPNDTPDQFTITLRLRVTDSNGLIGESRRTIYIHHDPNAMAGFPISIPGSGDPPPIFAPLNPGRSSEQQLLVPTSDGIVMALQSNGRELPGWPVHTGLLNLHLGSLAFRKHRVPRKFYEAIPQGIAAGDLDGDGRTEVAASTDWGHLYVWDAKGRLRRGFPVSTNPLFSAPTIRDQYNRLQRGFIATPVLANLDGSGKLDLIDPAMDRHLYVWRNDGTPAPGFPVLMIDRTQMASIDPLSNRVVPNVVSGHSVALQGTKVISMPAVGDLNGDGAREIVLGTNEEYRETPNFSSVGNSTAKLISSLGIVSGGNGRIYAVPADGNLDPDAATNPAGPFLPGWPVHIAILDAQLLPEIEGITAAPALADIDGNGKLEIGINSVVGPAYILRPDGSSYYGNGPDGLPIALPGDDSAFGTGTKTTETASFPALGSGIFVPEPSGGWAYATPALGFGKVLDAGLPAEQLPHDSLTNAWDVSTGVFLPGYPTLTDDDGFLMRPSSGIAGNDGMTDILAGTGGYLLHATDLNGNEAAGFPKFTGGWITATPAIGNFGGATAIAVTTREGNLYVWRVAPLPPAREVP
ncbi:MAG: S8 family serine peptidase [Candidatus Binataceae bacterium]